MSLFQILGWVLPIVFVSLGVGLTTGLFFQGVTASKRVRAERDRTLTALRTLLKSTETLTTEAGERSSQLKCVEHDVGLMQSAHDFDRLQATLLHHISGVLDANRQLEQDLVATRYELDQQAQQLDETKREARTDQLSGVANRKGLDEHLEYLLSKFHNKKEPFALILADVDHFKWINDTHGHAAGDKVVTRIGEVLKESVRPHDFVGRFGGDEFAILLSKVDVETAISVGQRIRENVEHANYDVGTNGARLAVTFSMGLAIPSPTDTRELILKRADRGLYRSKDCGRNQMHVVEASAEPCMAS